MGIFPSHHAPRGWCRLIGISGHAHRRPCKFRRCGEKETKIEQDKRDFGKVALYNEYLLQMLGASLSKMKNLSQ